MFSDDPRRLLWKGSFDPQVKNSSSSQWLGLHSRPTREPHGSGQLTRSSSLLQGRFGFQEQLKSTSHDCSLHTWTTRVKIMTKNVSRNALPITVSPPQKHQHNVLWLRFYLQLLPLGSVENVLFLYLLKGYYSVVGAENEPRAKYLVY